MSERLSYIPESSAAVPAHSPSFRRFAGMVGVWASLAAPVAASAEKPSYTPGSAAPNAPITECTFNYLAGPNTICTPADIPQTCVTPAVQQFVYQPAIRRKGAILANISTQEWYEGNSVEHLQMGGEDNGSVVDKNRDRARAVLFLARAEGVTRWRITLDPGRFYDPKQTHNYDEAVDNILACDMEPEITIACNLKQWKPETFRRYIGAVAKRFMGKVWNFSICNEPNFPGWLKAMPHLTLAETYEKLFKSGSNVLTRVAEQFSLATGQVNKLKIGFGDLNSRYFPMRFFREVLRASQKDTVNPEPLQADYFDYHPYKFEYPLELDNPELNWQSEELGPDGIPVVEGEVHRAATKGLLTTPDGQEPELHLNEYAQGERFTGSKASRNLTPGERARSYVEMWAMACRDKAIRLLSIFGFDEPPAWRRQHDDFNTGVVNENNQLDAAYYATRSWAQQHPTCLEK